MEMTKKVLATVFLDGKEICKKIHELCSASELIDSNSDCNADIKELDKFHIFFKLGSEQVSGQTEEPPVLVNHEGTQPCLPPSGEESGLQVLKALIRAKAPNLLTEYEECGALSTKSRMLLVRLAVSDLVQRQGFYPSSYDKVCLAKNLVAIFPKLSVKVQEHSGGYEHFYDPTSHSGFIEMKLRNLRRDIDDDQRRYRRKCKQKRVVALTMMNVDEDVSEWVTLAKRMKPSSVNFSTIKQAMDQTYHHRRMWILTQSPTLPEIFEQYPRFIDMPELFHSDFDQQFKGKADSFLRKWETYIIPRLMRIASKELSEELSCTTSNSDDMLCYRALQVLTHLLPPTASGRAAGYSRCSVKSAISYLLDFAPPGTCIPSLLENPDSSLKAQQPCILCLGHPEGIHQQYVIIARNDKITIPLGDDGLTSAVDKLFKMYWVCNLAYPVQLQSVFSFLEHIYEIPASGNKRSKVVELISKLQAI
ncbi:hypothetical protein OJAV_G00235880 [Oryzias javanicus]|uniref:Uncharacterized protein n=1 Tax=Oryzias javanicus TaxID=123683 RepID=A0A3S2P2I6_ORYJA|nr:hypothetical protein OJAV_G00235880 [Oryzias javanicus]